MLHQTLWYLYYRLFLLGERQHPMFDSKLVILSNIYYVGIKKHVGILNNTLAMTEWLQS